MPFLEGENTSNCSASRVHLKGEGGVSTTETAVELRFRLPLPNIVLIAIGLVKADNVLVRPRGNTTVRVQISPSSWTDVGQNSEFGIFHRCRATATNPNSKYADLPFELVRYHWRALFESSSYVHSMGPTTLRRSLGGGRGSVHGGSCRRRRYGHRRDPPPGQLVEELTPYLWCLRRSSSRCSRLGYPAATASSSPPVTFPQCPRLSTGG